MQGREYMWSANRVGSGQDIAGDITQFVGLQFALVTSGR